MAMMADFNLVVAKTDSKALNLTPRQNFWLYGSYLTVSRMHNDNHHTIVDTVLLKIRPF